MNYRVCIETGYDVVWAFAHVPELLGCFSKEKNREIALERLPDRIQNYLNWLKAQGESVISSQGITVKISQEFNCYMVGDYEVGACFEADRRSATPEEIHATIRRM